jgi:hypothetical protein
MTARIAKVFDVEKRSILKNLSRRPRGADAAIRLERDQKKWIPVLPLIML